MKKAMKDDGHTKLIWSTVLISIGIIFYATIYFTLYTYYANL
jgi:hypothetical protein